MNKTVLFCLTLCCAMGISSSYAKEPKNIELCKATLIQYHDSGEYQKDQAKVINKAMQYLKTRLENNKKLSSNKKMAIVLDIDETSLSNYADMIKMGFGGTLAQIIDAENEGDDTVIAPTLKLYQYAKANHVAVFFITGRTEDAREATEKNLTSAGYKNWDKLILKPNDYKEKTAAIYKTKTRADIENQGYDIVLNIGDQHSDLVGGYADKGFKLPNPYYIVP